MTSGLLRKSARCFPNVYRRYSVQRVPARDVIKTRNIGIIAHIDAGKTTVTERLLYLAGATRAIGDVDSGSTVTDFLDIERERGITVQSAAISFGWRDHKINLIDTPGHVDFTVEVERCARVLDGVVTVLDSTAGVQAQTLTVWRQASKFGLPATFFVNKMDKAGASLVRSVDSMEQRLGIKGLITVGTVSRDDKLVGLVDVVNQLSLDLTQDRGQWTKIEAKSLFFDEFTRYKDDLCYSLSDYDSKFLKLFMDDNNGSVDAINKEVLIQSISRATLSRKCAAVACGSALRNTQSVKPVLDQIIDYLPSPSNSIERIGKVFGDDLSALVFKISHDKRKGQLSYVRVYTGNLKNNTSVYNSSRSTGDGPLKLFVAHGDDLQPTASVGAGDIAVVSGLSATVTGNTLLASDVANNRALSTLTTSSHHSSGSDSKTVDLSVKRDGQNAVFTGIDIPEPVYFCSLEPPTTAAIHEFERALNEITVEDPSLRVRRDADTGQTVIETMGELHLDVIKDKFIRGYGLDVFIGPLQIGYREMVASSVEHTASVSDSQLQGEKARTHSSSITLLVKPSPGAGPFKSIQMDLPSGSPSVRYEWQKALSEGCSNALHNGPVMGFPVQDVSVILKALNVSGGRVNPAILSACAHKCLTEALSLSGALLVEPVMKVEVTVEGGDGTQPLLQELSRRRAQIDLCEGTTGGTSIVARMPLAEMENLSSVVRTLSSGLGSLHVEIADYSIVSEHDLSAIRSRS